ncbi:MAG: class I SAM-dependent methyltransferase [Bacteroidales bacterium]|jgi:ubiquinone/menaquinone biosynthesis C-methylase UbiE|nr:class I SAM-dependent methyltransferase [Bacteroidales bacterium]
MGLKHYFSSDPDKRARFIFNFIAPIYGYLGTSLERNFVYSMNAVEKYIPIKGKAVIDLGTGTGAWAANFKHRGADQVMGLDFAGKMLDKAKTNYPNMEFVHGDAENLENFADNSFDIVTASFVLHGLKEHKRANMLREMRRVSRKHIVIHDFIGETPLFIRFLEFMERSDYKFFKINICKELKAHFINARKIPTKFGTGIYIAEK